MTKEEEYYLDRLITDALTVETDEMEGQQVINLNTLDLCAADYAKTSVISDPSYDMTILSEIYSDPDIIKLLNASISEIPNLLSDVSTDTNVILEFADATINDPTPVYYEISVKPGEPVNSDTIIGTINQRGKIKTIKSIFEKGNVRGINDDTEYFHLYPSNCYRHIVLENVLDDNGSAFDLSTQLTELNDNFRKEGELYALITNSMPHSLLPYILSRRYRGVYKRDFIENIGYTKWYLNSSDLSADNTKISTYIQNNKFKNNKQYDTSLFIFDYENEQHDTGVKIYDASILQVLDDIQSEFGAKVIGEDVTQKNMKSWKKRAKKKKNRKKVKSEISGKVNESVNKIKTSPNPAERLKEEEERLLKARDNYINKVLDLYKNKDNLPLCKYDPEYSDCKFLVNDKIDQDVLNNVKTYDNEFKYSIGDTDDYYNYYFSLLGNLNLMAENEYVSKYYNLITDIINKRLIIETSDPKTLKRNFCNLFNDNVAHIFDFYQNEHYNTDEYVNRIFSKFENKVNVFVQNQNTKHANDIRDQFTKMNLGEEAIENAGSLYTADDQYQQIYDYIKNLYVYDKDEDTDTPNEIISQLATMYTYIKSYGNGQNNHYKDLRTNNDKYLYYKLVIEESKRICEFWDEIILEYEKCTLKNCLTQLDNVAHQFDDLAEWPMPTTITINNVQYQHYLFTNLYEKNNTTDISIGNYDFPDGIPEFPDIPDDASINEDEALDDLKNHEMAEFKDQTLPDIFSISYWQKYFTLATLICLVPSTWNCGLDIMPTIQNIQLPCIFRAIQCFHIPMFNMVIVFGIAIRGMYPWPVILYLNTSDRPVSILTPLVAVLNRLKTVFKQKINKLEYKPIENLANFYINKLNAEINEIKKENIKLENYKRAIKRLKIPKKAEIGKEFEMISDPSIDTRQKINRLETLAKRAKAVHNN